MKWHIQKTSFNVYKNGYKSVIIDIDNSIIRQKNKSYISNPLTYNIKNLTLFLQVHFISKFQNCVYGDVSIKNYQKNINGLKRYV